jgi:glutamine synthetase
VRLLDAMGVKTSGLVCNIGLEQEFFLIPRDAYFRRPDLQFTGRTLLGRFPARGQEMSDHYMAPLSDAQPALECMQAIQERCFKVGIPLRTRHREVAPNQYEFAPMFGTVVSQTDQNLVVMQIIEETAAKFGLAALMQEKPFQGINGSGKHNNWSISTAEGAQLLNPAQLYAKTGARSRPRRAAVCCCCYVLCMTFPRHRLSRTRCHAPHALTRRCRPFTQATLTSSRSSWPRWCPAWTSTAT